MAGTLGLGFCRPDAGTGRGDVFEGRGWAMWLIAAQYFSCEGWVVGEPSFNQRVMKSFVGWGSECGKGVQGKFWVLFVSYDVLGGSGASLGQ